MAIMTTMRYGIARGLFSNEAGLGSAPIIAAAAKSKNPVRQAMVLSSGVFWDSVVICTLTGLVIVSSILAYDTIDINEYEQTRVLVSRQYCQQCVHILTFTVSPMDWPTRPPRYSCIHLRSRRS